MSYTEKEIRFERILLDNLFSFNPEQEAFFLQFVKKTKTTLNFVFLHSYLNKTSSTLLLTLIRCTLFSFERSNRTLLTEEDRGTGGRHV